MSPKFSCLVPHGSTTYETDYRPIKNAFDYIQRHQLNESKTLVHLGDIIKLVTAVAVFGNQHVLYDMNSRRSNLLEESCGIDNKKRLCYNIAVMSSTQQNPEFDPFVAIMRMQDGDATVPMILGLEEWRRNVPIEEFVGVTGRATQDHVTGLRNAMGTEAYYDDMVRTAGDLGREAMFGMMVDLEAMGDSNQKQADGYTRTNFGLLRPYGAALKGSIRAGDKVGRTGGDEFMAVGISRDSVAVGDQFGDQSEVAEAIARGSLGRLVSMEAFADSESYILGSAGVIVKAATVPLDTPFEELTTHVEPKGGPEGVSKPDYDYTRLPHGSTLHRIYKDDGRSPFGKIGYLTASNEGGIFMPFDTNDLMSRALRDRDFVPEPTRSNMLSIDNVPKPYVVDKQLLVG